MKVAEFLSGWPVWGLPAFAQIWAPWHDKITNFHLISDYFQPALGGVTSTLGALACLITYGAIHSKGAAAGVGRLSSRFHSELFHLHGLPILSRFSLVSKPGSDGSPVVHLDCRLHCNVCVAWRAGDHGNNIGSRETWEEVMIASKIVPGRPLRPLSL